MEKIPTILRNDEFRQLIRDDLDFDQIKKLNTKKREQRITDGMTQLIVNTVNRFEAHSDYPFWNVVKLSRDFQIKVATKKGYKQFQETLEKNGFKIDHHYRIPIGANKGKTKAVTVPERKIDIAVKYLKERHLVKVQNNHELMIDWEKPYNFQGVLIPSRVRISTKVMKDVCDEVLEVSEQLYRDWNLHLRLDSAFQNDGWMEQNFIESDFGRLFGTGLSSLQSMPKEILKRVLNGCYELDVNTASLVILTEIHRRRFRVSSFSAIERFIRLKTWIREEVARSLEIDVSTVKTAFTAIGFGMRSNTKSYFNENGDIEVPTLTKTFGGDFRKSQEFLAHSEVKEFWIEMKNLFKELSRDSKNELSELKPSQRVAYLYQKEEAGILRSICRNVGKNLVVPKHDAIIVKELIMLEDRIKIQDSVNQETGFKIELSSKLLTSNDS